MRRRVVLLFLIALAAAVADLLTKEIFCSPQQPPTREIISGLLWFTPALNRGAAFSSFGGLENANLLLLAVSSVMIVWFLVLAFRQFRKAPIWPFALILGGAAGNMVDRLLPAAAVRDFLDLRWWPIFNLADVWISVGVFALVAWSVFVDRREQSVD